MGDMFGGMGGGGDMGGGSSFGDGSGGGSTGGGSPSDPLGGQGNSAMSDVGGGSNPDVGNVGTSDTPANFGQTPSTDVGTANDPSRIAASSAGPPPQGESPTGSQTGQKDLMSQLSEMLGVGQANAAPAAPKQTQTLPASSPPTQPFTQQGYGAPAPASGGGGGPMAGRPDTFQHGASGGWPGDSPLSPSLGGIVAQQPPGAVGANVPPAGSPGAVTPPPAVAANPPHQETGGGPPAGQGFGGGSPAPQTAAPGEAATSNIPAPETKPAGTTAETATPAPTAAAGNEPYAASGGQGPQQGGQGQQFNPLRAIIDLLTGNWGDLAKMLGGQGAFEGMDGKGMPRQGYGGGNTVPPQSQPATSENKGPIGSPENPKAVKPTKEAGTAAPGLIPGAAPTGPNQAAGALGTPGTQTAMAGAAPLTGTSTVTPGMTKAAPPGSVLGPLGAPEPGTAPQAATPDLTNQTRRGSANYYGSQAARAAGHNIAPGSPQAHDAVVTTKSGAKLPVNSQAAPHFQSFVNELENMGYQINPRDSYGFANRNIKNTGMPSQHSYGNAIDLNASANPQTPHGPANMPPNISAIAAKHGLTWGGDWSPQYRDPMHFEWTGAGAGQTAVAAAPSRALPAPGTRTAATGAPATTTAGGSGRYAKADAYDGRQGGGTRGDRNNNPGNIKGGPYPGQVGTDAQGHAIFQNWGAGRQAQASLLQQKYNNQTVPQMARYANGDQGWVRNVMRYGGFGPNEKLNLNDPATMERLQTAIWRSEGTRIPGGDTATAARGPGAIGNVTSPLLSKLKGLYNKADSGSTGPQGGPLAGRPETPPRSDAEFGGPPNADATGRTRPWWDTGKGVPGQRMGPGPVPEVTGGLTGGATKLPEITVEDTPKAEEKPPAPEKPKLKAKDKPKGMPPRQKARIRARQQEDATPKLSPYGGGSATGRNVQPGERGYEEAYRRRYGASP